MSNVGFFSSVTSMKYRANAASEHGKLRPTSIASDRTITTTTIIIKMEVTHLHCTIITQTEGARWLSG